MKVRAWARVHWRRLVVVVAAIVLVAYFVGASDAVHACVSGQPQPDANQPPKERSADFSLVFISRPCWGVFLEKDEAALVGLSTVALVIVTGVLALYTYRLWSATQDMVGKADAAARAQSADMQNSVAAMTRLAAATEDSAERQLRAYLEFEPTSLNGSALMGFGDANASATGIIRNRGQTPAYHVHIGHRIGWMPLDFPESTSIDVEFALGILSPDGHVRLFTPTITVTAEERKSSTPMRLFFYGIILYEDAFRKKWRQRFCYYLDFSTGQPRSLSAGRWNDEVPVGQEERVGVGASLTPPGGEARA